ncbi:MAG: hypothetical protein LLF89_11280 [Spirochaetaceae bacterium]|nr:hypothetical protein [Spirochaetaceae bacterium]
MNVISFERWKDGFLLTVEGKRVLRHASASPALYAGMSKPGTAKAKSEGLSDAAIAANPLKWKALGACTVANEGADSSVLRFDDGLSLKLEYSSQVLRLFISSAPNSAGQTLQGFRLQVNADPHEKLYGLGPCGDSSVHHDVKKTKATLRSSLPAVSTVFANSGAWLRAWFSGQLSWHFDAGKTVVEVNGVLPELAMGFSPSPLEGFSALAGCSNQGGGEAVPLILETADGESVQVLLRKLLSLSFSGEGVIGIPAKGALADMAAFSPLFILENRAQSEAGSGRKVLDFGADSAELAAAASKGSTSRQLQRAATIFSSLKPYHEYCRQRWEVWGWPTIVQPAVYYPADELLWDRDDEYLYGPDLLVAPLDASQGGPRQLLLPDDEWIHFWTSRRYGGGVAVVDAQPGRPAVFYRGKSEFARLFDTIRQMATRL